MLPRLALNSLAQPHSCLSFLNRRDSRCMHCVWLEEIYSGSLGAATPRSASLANMSDPVDTAGLQPISRLPASAGCRHSLEAATSF